MKLEAGYNGSFTIREYCCHAAAVNDFTILYLSDLHFNKYSSQYVLKIIDAVNKLSPTVILLGGDYFDNNKGLLYFQKLLHALSSCRHVYAVAGNHDYFSGIDTVKNVITSCGINWIERSSVIIELNGTNIQIDGNVLQQPSNDTNFSIACMHKPVDIKNYNYNLAFAGHLHGGQFVLWQHKNALYPGKFFYKWNVLEQHVGDTVFLISKGLGDTLPLRWNCKKEMIFVTVTSQKLS